MTGRRGCGPRAPTRTGTPPKANASRKRTTRRPPPSTPPWPPACTQPLWPTCALALPLPAPANTLTPLLSCSVPSSPPRKTTPNRAEQKGEAHQHAEDATGDEEERNEGMQRKQNRP